MPQTKTASPSIIETIDKMVKDGESEEKILNTLKDIGISADNARRLLILGQADVFSLLKGEIRKNIRVEMEREETDIKKATHDEAIATMEETKQQIARSMVGEIKEYEKSLANQNKSLQEQLEAKIAKIADLQQGTKSDLVNQNKALQDQIMGNIRDYEKNLTTQTNAKEQQFTSKIESIAEIEEKNQRKINEMTQNVKKIQADFAEAGVKGVAGGNKLMSYVVVLLGLVFGAGTLYIFYTNLNAPFTTYSLIVMTVMAIITVTLLVIGTLI